MPNFKTKSYLLEDLQIISSKNLKELKLKFLPMCCPLCGKELNESSPFDHQHMTRNETIGECGAGLLRSLLCNNCNIFLGKIENNSRRYCIEDLCKFLRNAAQYLESDNLPIIHPSETHRIKEKISKSQYNKIIKHLCENSIKPKEYFLKKYKYPKNGFITKDLKKLKEKILNFEENKNNI